MEVCYVVISAAWCAFLIGPGIVLAWTGMAGVWTEK